MDDKPLIILKELYGNPPPELNTLQLLLAPHVEFLTYAWIVVWSITALTMLAILVREYRARNHVNKK